MARCWALRMNLKEWRCNNPAGKKLFCHQHRRWPAQRLFGLIGILIVGFGFPYLYESYGPKTKVERAVSENQKSLEDIKNLLLLESKSNRASTELTTFIEQRELSLRYPLGFAIFYSDGRKNLYFGKSSASGVSFDPSVLQTTIKYGGRAYCLNVLPIRIRGQLIPDVTGVCFGSDQPGQIIRAMHWNDVDIDIEPLAGSSDGVAWIIGMRSTAQKK